jgi:hypothetical protein
MDHVVQSDVSIMPESTLTWKNQDKGGQAARRGQGKEFAGCSPERLRHHQESDGEILWGAPAVGVIQVLGILGEYEKEHPGAIQRFQQRQAEVDERLLQQALRRQEHQHARFIQDAERARYIKNFQARLIIKRALRRQIQQQAAARYEQYEAQSRRLKAARASLEQTMEEVLCAMKQREEERLREMTLFRESAPRLTEGPALELPLDASQTLASYCFFISNLDDVMTHTSCRMSLLDHLEWTSQTHYHSEAH